MQFHFDPSIYSAKIKFNPTSPFEVEQRNIATHAISMSYDIEEVSHGDYFIEFEVVESNRRKANVQIYLPNLFVCSCEDYCKHECGLCKHISVLKYMLKHYPTDKFSRSLKSRLAGLHYSGNKKFIVYDSLKCKETSIGNSENIQLSVSSITHRKLSGFTINTDSNSINLPSPYMVTNGVTLYDYQHSNATSMLRAKRAVSCMYMGMGKTLTTTACIKHIGTDNVLIVCPKSVIGQWEKECIRCLGITPMVLSGTNVEKFAQSKNGIGITTYSTFSRNSKILSKRKYTVIVADEIQFIRNNESKTWTSFKKLKSEYFYGLSGTIIENRLDDLYNIMDIIYPGLLGAKWKFDSQFKVIDSVCRTKVLYKNEIQNQDKLRDLIRNNVFSYFDHAKKKPTPFTDYVNMDDSTQSTHDYFLAQAKILVAKSLQSPLTFGEKARLQAYYLRARQCCNSPNLVDANDDPDSEKLDKIVQLISDYHSKNEKVVVFSEWTKMINLIIDKLPSTIGYTRFDGGMNLKQRSKSLKEFQDNSDCTVFFSTDAGGIGLDGLQLVCNAMIHTELPWNPARIDQRIGRIDRIGQTNPVTVHFVVTEDSIESSIESLVKSKRDIREGVLLELN